MNGVNHKLQELWQARHCGDLEHASNLYRSLEVNLKIAPSEKLETVASKFRDLHLSTQNLEDFWSFRSANARRNLNVPAAQQCLDELENYLREIGEDVGFQLIFQSGLNNLVSGRSMDALKCFQSAKRLARTKQEYFSSFLNSLCCMEDIGFDFSDARAQFIDEFKAFKSELWADSVASQWHAMEIRFAFYEGNWPLLQSLLDNSVFAGQGYYHLMWLASLPYLQLNARAKCKQTLFESLTINQEYMTDFRLGTIQGIPLASEVTRNARVTEMIDRIYLWVWQWLAEPSFQNAKRVWSVMPLLFHFKNVTICPKQYRMVENGVRWIRLFLDLSARNISNLLAPYHCATSSSPSVFDLESALLDFIYASREKSSKEHCEQSRFKLIEQLKFSPAPQILKSLAKSVLSMSAKCEITALSESLQTMLSSDHSHKALIINPIHKEICIATSEPIKSEQLTNLLFLFRDRTACAAATVLADCFCLGSYRFDAHASKLSALISRANKIFPGVRFSFKNDGVFCDADRSLWGFEDATAHHLSLYQTQDRSSAQIRSTANRQEPDRDATEDKSDWLTRQEIQALMGLSRATTARRLALLQLNSKCESKGAGKATRYRLPTFVLRDVLAQKEHNNA